eukprot:4153765-Pyramimonas_sp.AAC.1
MYTFRMLCVVLSYTCRFYSELFEASGAAPSVHVARHAGGGVVQRVGIVVEGGGGPQPLHLCVAQVAQVQGAAPLQVRVLLAVRVQ